MKHNNKLEEGIVVLCIVIQNSVIFMVPSVHYNVICDMLVKQIRCYSTKNSGIDCNTVVIQIFIHGVSQEYCI